MFNFLETTIFFSDPLLHLFIGEERLHVSKHVLGNQRTTRVHSRLPLTYILGRELVSILAWLAGTSIDCFISPALSHCSSPQWLQDFALTMVRKGDGFSIHVFACSSLPFFLSFSWRQGLILIPASLEFIMSFPVFASVVLQLPAGASVFPLFDILLSVFIVLLKKKLGRGL